jgi:hypothetical protein
MENLINIIENMKMHYTCINFDFFLKLFFCLDEMIFGIRSQDSEFSSMKSYKNEKKLS